MSKAAVISCGLVLAILLVAWVLIISDGAIGGGGAPQAIVFETGYSAPDITDPAALLAEDIRYLSMDHALERHGEISVTIRNACEESPAVKRTRAKDGRQALACEFEPGKWGVAIYEAGGDFITAFRNKAQCLDDVLQYFRNRGYTQ